jgi:acetyl-CoA carboxylase biotin carboxylase subunit
VAPAGHAIECRINAEDAERGFRPSPGTVTAAVFPVGDGIRVDTHVQAGAAVPPHYDSLLAKLIVHRPDRPAAVAHLQAALRRCQIAGVATNLPLHQRIVRHPEFVAGGVGTAFLGNGHG